MTKRLAETEKQARKDERQRKRAEKFRAKWAAFQAELDAGEESIRRLKELTTQARFICDLIGHCGPGSIRIYCVYRLGYKQAITCPDYAELMPRFQPHIDAKLADMDVWNPWAAEEWSLMYNRGRVDALARTPIRCPPDGFPLDLL